MTTSKEMAYAEQPAVEWLRDLGWTFLHGPDIAPDTPAAERAEWTDLLLRGRLSEKVAQLNPQLPDDAVQQVVRTVAASEFDTPIRDHAAFHELLINGVRVRYRRDGDDIFDEARLVDFRDPHANDLLAVNQFSIRSGSKVRRPDVLLFVNGIPLGQIELKSPTDEAATPETAVNQIAHYRSTIPSLYRFVEIIGVSDLHQARIGTITTPAEHFAQWKSMDPANDTGRTQLEVMLRGAFAPAAFLDLVENFVLFERSGDKTVKVMAKYHQVQAVNSAVEATAAARGKSGRAGVVWHTQGAGKSYTMVFYASKLRRDPRFANPTVVAVTDRIDLDDQLRQTFARQPHLESAVRAATSVGDEPDGLRSLLRVQAGGIIFTTIQKFQAPDEAQMPVLSERSNIIVMADEAHRSQYAQFARNLAAALPNATRIGFTGTPIERDDRSTQLTFGTYVSVYDITRAVEDGATVPIFYESRPIPLVVEDRALLESVEQALQSEDPEAANRLIAAEARLDRIAGASNRLDRLADDIAEHFTARSELMFGKALVVGMTRLICTEVTDRLRARLGDEAVDCVISATANEDERLGRFRRNKAEMRQVADDFKAPEHPLRLVVVRDMWLTGFDVPSLHTLYLDRPMKDHGLLQAIARVNRVFRDKPGGLVVDYIGIGDDLRRALPAYRAEDIEHATVPLETLVAKLREKHKVLSDLLHGVPFQDRHEMTSAQAATMFGLVVQNILADEDVTRTYLDEHLAFSKSFALVSPNHEATVFQDDAEFFSDVARAARKLTPAAHDPSGAARQAVKQFFSEGLAAGEIATIFEIADKDRPEISVLSDEFLNGLDEQVRNPDLQVALLRKLLDDEIRSQRRTSALQSKLFSDELEGLLGRYRQRQVQSAEIVEALIALAKKMRRARRRHEALGLTPEEAAFYDALAGTAEDWQADEQLAAVAREIVSAVKKDLSVDWTTHESREAAVRRNVRRLLRRSKYEALVARLAKQQGRTTNGGGGGGDSEGRRATDRAADLILQQARAMYRYWPDVEVSAV